MARPEWVDSTSRSALAVAMEGEKLKQRLVAAQRVRAPSPTAFSVSIKATELQLVVRLVVCAESVLTVLLNVRLRPMPMEKMSWLSKHI